MKCRPQFSFIFLMQLIIFPIHAASTPQKRFDAAHSIGVDATFEGTIETDNDEPHWFLADIRDQLFYTVGALNEHHSVGDIAQTKIKILKNVLIQGTEFFRVTYSALMIVAWPLERPFPGQWRTGVPLRVTEPGKKEFFLKYGSTCNSGDPATDSDTFYYYIRPEIPQCLMLKEFPNGLATELKMTFKKSSMQTNGKSPEYHKIWEDKALIGTLIFGNDQDHVTGNNDWGIYAAQQTYSELIQALGTPTSSNISIQPGKLPSNESPYAELEWIFADGKKINMAMMLIQSKLLAQASPSFRSKYSERTQISDYVSYNGHSGYGDNIRELANLGVFTKDQYQLFRIYGCDTYAYVSDLLGIAHAKVNPGASTTKYLDMITAAYPGSFGDMGTSNVSIIKGLIDSKATYRQILAQINQLSRPIVTGEEDNRWPAPF